jgi:hypothetical protein
VSDLENRRMKIVGEPDEGEPHVRFDVAGDGQPGYGNGTEALSEEMERNGSALPKSQAPSPDPTISWSALAKVPILPKPMETTGPIHLKLKRGEAKPSQG